MHGSCVADAGNIQPGKGPLSEALFLFPAIKLMAGNPASTTASHKPSFTVRATDGTPALLNTNSM